MKLSSKKEGVNYKMKEKSTYQKPIEPKYIV